MSSAFPLLLLLLFARSFRSFVRSFGAAMWSKCMGIERERVCAQSCEGESVELELVFMDSMREI